MKIPTLRFVFDRKHVASKTHRGLVQLEVLFEGKRKWIGTGIKLYAGQWKDKKMCVNAPNMIDVNEALEALRSRIQEWINSLIRNGEAFSFTALDDFLRARKDGNNFVDYIGRRIEERTDIRDSTRSTHRKLLSKLQTFGKIVYFSDLTLYKIEAFDNWLRSQGITQVTIWGYHKTMKVYIHDAIHHDLLANSPYENFKVERGKSNGRRYLTPEELKKVEEAVIPIKKIDRVRDVFVFQCYTGLAYADLSRFDFNKVEKRGERYVLRDVRQKSNEEYYIVLLSPAIRILRKYKNRLPIISNQQYNKQLKQVSFFSRISKEITSHMGRHTFAVMCLSKGAKIENVSKMMGHINIATTQIYAKVLNRSLEQEFDMIESTLKH